MSTSTSGNGVTVTTTVNLAPPPHPRLADFMENVCERLGHFGGCALLNGRWDLFYDDERDEARMTIRWPLTMTRRLFGWAAFPR